MELHRKEPLVWRIFFFSKISDFSLTEFCTVSYSINERNFNSVKWELGDKKVQKNVHMVYEHPLFIYKKKKCEKVCTKKN